VRNGEPFDLVVRGRLGLPGREAAPGAIGIRAGRVAAVTERSAALTALREVDAGDALVLPGVVDSHVHTRSAPQEGIETASRAAAAGGVTTLVDMPYDSETLIATVEAFEAKVADVELESLVDVSLWATVPPAGPLDQVAGLVQAGACGFKLSTFNTDSRRFPRIDDAQLLRAFGAIAEAGSLAALHSENDEIVRAGIAAEKADGARDALAHARSRPAVAETEAIGRVLELALATGVSVHLCHVTVGRGVKLASRALGDGVDVTAETCPHYLLLDEDDFAARGGELKINPPLRSAAEVEALWAALTDGALDYVASDHVGWAPERKRGDDVLALSSGAPGLELMLVLMHGAMASRGLGTDTLVRALSEAPARRLGLWPRKGNLLPGADADLVVLDPGVEWVVHPEKLVTACGWSPYTGRTVSGLIRHVFCRGQEVFADGRVLAGPGHGTFVASRA
jgi:allantoinase